MRLLKIGNYKLGNVKSTNIFGDEVEPLGY